MAQATDDPTLQDFYHDMNEHGNAEYHRVPPHHVVEAESHDSSDRSRLVVWKAVKDGGEYAEPDIDGNGYVWDAVGSTWFDTYNGAVDVADELTTVGKIEEWCNAHPYDGPKTPYAERSEE